MMRVMVAYNASGMPAHSIDRTCSSRLTGAALLFLLASTALQLLLLLLVLATANQARQTAAATAGRHLPQCLPL